MSRVNVGLIATLALFTALGIWAVTLLSCEPIYPVYHRHDAACRMIGWNNTPLSIPKE